MQQKARSSTKKRDKQRRTRVNAEELDKQIAMTAFYFAVGLDEKEIAKILDPTAAYSVTTVQARKRKAEQLGYLQTVLQFKPRPDLVEKISTQLSDKKLEEDIETRFAITTLKKIIVIPNFHTPSIELVARTAALLLGTSLRENDIVGVSFGRTCREVAKFANVLEIDQKKKKGVRCVPMMGVQSVLQLDEPELWDCDANANSLRLSQAFVDAQVIKHVSLPTPAFVPKNFVMDPENPTKIDDKRIDIALEFARSVPEYQEIFVGTEDRKPLISQMTVMITSLGPPPTVEGQIDDGWLGKQGPIYEEGEREQLVEATPRVVGDIGGKFILENGKLPDKEHIAYRLNRRILGPSPEHFITVAERARYDGQSIGVLAIAHGDNKAPAVLSALQLNAINTLVIDKACASALLDLVNSRKGQ